MERRLIELTAELELLPRQGIPVSEQGLKHAELCREREQLRKQLGALVDQQGDR
jgi:hypothetical protein